MYILLRSLDTKTKYYLKAIYQLKYYLLQYENYFYIYVYMYMCIIHFQAFGLRLVQNIYNDVTWTVKDTVEDDGPFSIDKEVRITVLDFACALEHKKALKEAERIFMDWFISRKMPHPDIRELVYYYG